MGCRVVHFEVHAADTQRAMKFYESYLGWRFQQFGDQPYWLITTGDADSPGINGGLLPRRGDSPTEGSAVNSYVCTVEVPSLDEKLARAFLTGRKTGPCKDGYSRHRMAGLRRGYRGQYLWDDAIRPSSRLKIRMSVQNILNGESIVETFKRTSLGGDYHAWREDVTTGATPAPGALTGSWIDLRARELAREFDDKDRETVEEGLKQQEEVLESSLDSDEVILWFENDYFCQMNQTYLLSWYGRHSQSLPRISIFDLKEDIFFGHLQPADFEKLHSDRVPVSQEIIALATRAWDAASSPDPLSLSAMLASDTSALPQLHRTLICHLSRFPSVKNGLGRVENLVLEIAASGK